jgi:hypothetical protein
MYSAAKQVLVFGIFAVLLNRDKAVAMVSVR